MKFVDASADENDRLVIKADITREDYERLKSAFDKGELKHLGIMSISVVSPESASPAPKGFAKAEEHKRVPRKKSDSPHDRP